MSKLAAGKCSHFCAGGHRCNCNAQYRHVYHICKRPDCVCHSREVYERGRNDNQSVQRQVERGRA